MFLAVSGFIHNNVDVLGFLTLDLATEILQLPPHGLIIRSLGALLLQFPELLEEDVLILLLSRVTILWVSVVFGLAREML